jgi:F-type H+-transporting ATPase subunit epsilon
VKVEIVTPDSVIFTGDQVHLIQLPGIDGSFEVMNNHAALISVLAKGKIKVLNKGENEPLYFEIKGGVIEVQNNKVMILAE